METRHHQLRAMNSVQVKHSKTDQAVPVVNGVHLHSIYNPEREANGLVSTSLTTLEKSKNILVFGLGFGYHIVKLEEKLRQLHPKKYNIFVVEPNTEIVAKWKELKPTTFTENVYIASYETIKEFYQDTTLVDFMSNRPAVIPHPASFQSNMPFFKDFMSFCYPKGIEDSVFFVESDTFKDYLTCENKNESTEEIFERVRGKSFLQSYDFLTLALSEIVQSI